MPAVISTALFFVGLLNDIAAGAEGPAGAGAGSSALSCFAIVLRASVATHAPLSVSFA
jgi:hypothetical protein